MSIEIGSKWVKDGEVVEVENIKDNHFNNDRTSRIDCVWFWDEQGRIHVLTERDFLEQYKPYEIAYEWRWVICKENCEMITAYYTDKEAEKEFSFYSKKQRIDFTKRERK